MMKASGAWDCNTERANKNQYRCRPAIQPVMNTSHGSAWRSLKIALALPWCGVIASGGDVIKKETPPAADLSLADELLDEAQPPARTLPAPAPAAGMKKMTAAAEAHTQLFTESKFPSATTCAVCHPDHFREWSVSSHAYAQMSPIFNAMHATIVQRTSGTNGDFCIRCHTQVGMQQEEPLLMSNLDRSPASREGITCIVCHRVDRNYGKVSGRTSIVEGDVFEPVYGPKGNNILKEVLAQPAKFKVVTNRGEAGRAIHTDAIRFDPITTPAFCGSCHDVNLLNGFRLEEAFTQFKNTAAARRGETCQDCHMGRIPGLASGYAQGPAAIVGGVPTPDRKRTNHMFAGPDHSVIHPGIFPHNTKAQELATLREWLQFDHEAGWGTDRFENKVTAGHQFPERWKSIDDRYDARKILDDQHALLEVIRAERYKVLRRGYQLGDFVITRNDARGLAFKVQAVNGTDGHGVPTGFDAERLVFIQVTVTDAAGRVVFQSGDRDPNGDVRDMHSLYVHNNELPLDRQLFSLQSKFLTRNIRGGEREQVLAVNYSADPLPYIRPDTTPGILIARPGGARKQAMLLPPKARRWADYSIPGKQLTGQAPYTVTLRLIAQMVPVNLLDDIQEVGFDYMLSPREIARRVVHDAHLLWERTVVISAGQTGTTVSLAPREEEIVAPPPRIQEEPQPQPRSTLAQKPDEAGQSLLLRSVQASRPTSLSP